MTQASSALTERLRAVGRERYHDKHPFHVAMHAGLLSKEQLRGWVQNRYYYQTIIPIKDALLLSKTSELGPEARVLRRAWVRRIHDHDDPDGGLEQWERLAAGVGLDVDELQSLRRVLPAVRFACDAYVTLVRERSLLEAVASSLTEFFAPDIMRTRIAAWEKHYAWIDPAVLDYFRARPAKATRDSGEALAWVRAHAKTAEQEDACVRALETKCDILWAMLDGIATAT
jgi:pyrroloquinoline-quinone synthase